MVTDEGFPLLTLPKSLVLYLASDDKTPNVAGVTLVDGNTGNQMKLLYPTFRMGDYDPKTLADRKLYMLLPFFPMKYRDLRNKHDVSYEECAKSEFNELGKLFGQMEQGNILDLPVIEDYRDRAKHLAENIYKTSGFIMDKKGVAEAMENIGEMVIEFPDILYTIRDLRSSGILRSVEW